MITLKVERPSVNFIQAAQAVIQERKCYTYELQTDVYGVSTLTVECTDYESFRWLVSVMDEERFFND